MTEYSRRWTLPMHDMSSLRTTFRNIAENDDRAERLRLHDLFVSQLEVLINQQSNNTQVALWLAQEEAYTKIDHLHEQTANTNVLLSGVIDAVNGLRGVVEASATESAARLGKLEEGQERLSELVGDLARDFQESKRESMSDRADLRRVQGIHTDQIGALQRDVDLIKRHLGLGDGQ